MKINVTPNLLCDLLRYEPETGKLFWRVRDRAFFDSNRSCSVWNARYSGKEAGSLSSEGYIKISVMGTDIYGHRAAWAIFHGEWPDHCDHDDGDRTNNRIENLNNASKAQNQKNQKRSKRNSTGITGVYAYKNGWTAQITQARKTRHLGVFASFDDAVKARKAAEHQAGFNKNHGRSA